MKKTKYSKRKCSLGNMAKVINIEEIIYADNLSS